MGVVNDIANARFEMVTIQDMLAGLCQHFVPPETSHHDGPEALDLMVGWHGRPTTFLFHIARRMGWSDM
jgi:hypothetical protein